MSDTEKKPKSETYKLIFEFLKHMTTLSSGSVLLLVTFMEKIVRGAAPGKFIGIAFGGFCGSIVAALFAMLLIAFHVEREMSDSEATILAWALIGATVGFFIGISSLVLAAGQWI